MGGFDFSLAAQNCCDELFKKISDIKKRRYISKFSNCSHRSACRQSISGCKSRRGEEVVWQAVYPLIAP